MNPDYFDTDVNIKENLDNLLEGIEESFINGDIESEDPDVKVEKIEKLHGMISLIESLESLSSFSSISITGSFLGSLDIFNIKSEKKYAKQLERARKILIELYTRLDDSARLLLEVNHLDIAEDIRSWMKVV